MKVSESSAAAPGRAARRPLHPLVAAAAIAVIVASAAGVAAMTGLLPRLSAQSAPQEASSLSAAPAEPPAPAAAASRPAPAAAAKPAPRGAAPVVCAECGTVESVREVRVPVANQGPNLVGTVAGGVVGGVVGNQFGGGHGRDALTVLGAVGGALAGHEIERNIRGQQTVTRYEMSVRMTDGSLRTFHSEAPFALASGDHVRVENGRVVLLR